jgi:hypothetical protein
MRSRSSEQKMKLSRRDQIWNRAAMEAGGPDPREGDSALAALLLLHGMAMNGGIDHAIEVLSSEEYTSALKGFRYFGLEQAAALLEKATGATQLQLEQLNAEYGAVVPSDGTLVHAFQVKLLSSPEAFAPVGA